MRVVKKPAERKSEIVKAARELFLSKDYEKTTMQDCMNALGIAKGTIYHYFRSKEELFEAVIENIVNELLEKMEMVAHETEGNALQKMEALVRSGRANAPLVVEQLHAKGNEALHLRLLVGVLMRQAPLFAALIRQGCREGLFQTDSPLECAELMLSGVQFLTDEGIHPWSQEVLKRRMEAFPSLIEQLLKAAPGSFQFLKEEDV